MGALNLIKKLIYFALISSFGVPTGSIAQELPICTHQYYDADGDGFGWQNEASCLITSSSEPPPDFTNKSTGEPVTFVRPYWDGNTDIANRNIRCDRYDYQPATGEYLRPVDPATFNTLPDLTLTHQSISTARKYTPFIGTDQDQQHYGWYALSRDSVQFQNDVSLQTSTMPLWRTNDGLYESPELLQSPYIELVNLQGTKAIRIWFNEGDRFNTAYEFIERIHSTEGYFQCYDESGADFGPTGQIGSPGATPEPTLQDLVVSGPSNDWFEADEVVNLATGEAVQLSTAYWNYNDDIAGRLVQCDEKGYHTSCNNSGGYSRGCGFAEVDPFYYMMPWHLTDSTSNHGSNLHWWRRFLGVRSNSKVSYTDRSIAPGTDLNIVPMFLRSDLVELVDDDKVRIWLEATDIGHSRYYECSVYPTGTTGSEATNTETTTDTPDGSSDQSDGSNDQTDSSNGGTQTEGNNQSETSDTTNNSIDPQAVNVTSRDSGGGSIDVWLLCLFLSLLGLHFSSIRKNPAPHKLCV